MSRRPSCPTTYIERFYQEFHPDFLDFGDIRHEHNTFYKTSIQKGLKIRKMKELGVYHDIKSLVFKEDREYTSKTDSGREERVLHYSSESQDKFYFASLEKADKDGVIRAKDIIDDLYEDDFSYSVKIYRFGKTIEMLIDSGDIERAGRGKYKVVSGHKLSGNPIYANQEPLFTEDEVLKTIERAKRNRSEVLPEKHTRQKYLDRELDEAAEKAPERFSIIGPKDKIMLLHRAFREVVPDEVLEEIGYNNHGILPGHIHKSKTNHQIAVDILADYILNNARNGAKEEKKIETIEEPADNKDDHLPEFAKKALAK